jgi:hypothetical protein
MLWLLLPAIVIGAASPRPARSQSAEDKAAAEALFDEGKKLLGEKRFAEACARFESSQRLDPGTGTLLFLADCYETMGRTASAWSTFREAAAAAKAAGKADREKTARDRAAKLDGKLFQLTLSVGGASTPGLRVMREDIEVKKEVWGLAVPVDPGTYKLTVTAPGKKEWSTTVEVPKGAGNRTIDVPALEDAPKEAPLPTATATASATVTAVPSASPSGTATPPPGGWSTGRSAGLVLGVIGLAGVGVGAALGGVALSQYSGVETGCPNTACADPAIVDRSKQAGTMADASTALFAVGGAVLAGGVILFLVSPATARPAAPEGAASGSTPRPAARTVSARTTWISPMIGNGAAGFRAGSNW